MVALREPMVTTLQDWLAFEVTAAHIPVWADWEEREVAGCSRCPKCGTLGLIPHAYQRATPYERILLFECPDINCGFTDEI